MSTLWYIHLTVIIQGTKKTNIKIELVQAVLKLLIKTIL